MDQDAFNPNSHLEDTINNTKLNKKWSRADKMILGELTNKSIMPEFSLDMNTPLVNQGNKWQGNTFSLFVAR